VGIEDVLKIVIRFFFCFFLFFGFGFLSMGKTHRYKQAKSKK